MGSIIKNTRVLSPLLNLIPPNSAPDLYPSALAHFSSIPWAAALLDAPNTIPFIPQCRNPVSPKHDQFFSTTLATETGLKHMLCFFTRPDNLWDPSKPVEKASTLFELGHGLTGVPSVLHGGMTMSMVDEAMGVLTELNAALGKQGEAFNSASVTGTLEIKFSNPIPTGTTVMATSWIEKVEGRKTRIRCELHDENGLELAQCASTWVALRVKI